jgi:hypothetical protein
MWMVVQLATPACHKISVVRFRMTIVPAHAPLKSLSDAFVGTLDVAVPT